MKTKKQLEAELAQAKQEAEFWREAHRVLAGALAEASKGTYQPIWIAPYVQPHAAPPYEVTCDHKITWSSPSVVTCDVTCDNTNPPAFTNITNCKGAQ